MPRPAVAFETVPPAPVDALPRMDVAAFVGFASSGPVDVPVAVEDLAQFSDIFGDPPELAYDVRRGAMELAWLGPSVEAFFAHGGRRCWVVRVAELDARTDTLSLPVPGLAAASAPDAPVSARARSPGPWAAGLRAHATLIETPLGAPTLAWGGPGPAASMQLQVPAVAGLVTPGQTVRVSALGGDLLLFAVIARVDVLAGALRLTAGAWVAARRVLASVPPLDEALQSPRLEVLSPAPLDLAPGSPWAGSDLQADLVGFELSAWRGDAPQGRIAGLEFAAAHPRFWARLPDDDALFWNEPVHRADGRDDEAAALNDEARGARGASSVRTGQRFPFAGATSPAPLYLPQAMSRARRPAAAADDTTVLPRSGLEQPVLGMFLDARLGSSGSTSLIASAETIQSQARELARSGRGPDTRRLRGIHALLHVDEVTLVGAPDAAHAGWSTRARAGAAPLDAPELLAASFSSSATELLAQWTRVPGATAYQLQVADAADFGALLLDLPFDDEPAGSGPMDVHFALPPGCAEGYELRVGARRFGEPSPWSNTRRVGARAGDFQRCAQLAVGSTLRARVDGGALLVWDADGGALVLDARFELQSAADALFESALQTRVTSDRSLELPISGDGLIYWRVRQSAADAGLVGPWSNTVSWLPPQAARPLLDADRPFDPALLLAVQRGLLRLCQARGDMLALLALPRDHGAGPALLHLGALTPGSEDAALPSLAGQQPLGYGEAAALSYGALFHPWVAHRIQVAAGRSEPRTIPPEGAAAGQLAQVALARGAWIAGANRPLAGVLSTATALTDDDIGRLLGAQINVIARAAPGFVILDQQTLGRDSDTRAVSVRRLLILLRRLALREGAGIVFEPNDTDLQERIYTDFERVLSLLHRRGAFKGTNADEAFDVIADASVNPQAGVDAGRFVVELRVAPSQPLKFLRLRLVQGGAQSVSFEEA